MSDRRIKKLVRLTKAAKFPQHGYPPDGDKDQWPKWKDWRGKPIRVFAKRVEPSVFCWTCGTGSVWEVCPETIEKIVPASLRRLRFFVCEHSIQTSKGGKPKFITPVKKVTR